jgi:hypothetical protein
MTRPPQQLRPRYGRIVALAGSLAVTVVAALGGAGVLPSGSTSPAAAATPRGAITPASSTVRAAVPQAARVDVGAPAATSDDTRVPPSTDTALPGDSGTGRRVVFSESRQRVWLVTRDGRVARTYPVSGSLTDNLDVGRYEVYSRSERAWGIDDSGTMRYFVRFAHGDNAAIGFHDIPVLDGRKVQGVDDLGTPQSHGCIRQRRADAVALWRFAPLGTRVVVTA